MDAVLRLPVLEITSKDEAFDFFLGVCSYTKLKGQVTRKHACYVFSSAYMPNIGVNICGAEAPP
jgi:hypothetical protein